MFQSSTQKKYWTFALPEDIRSARNEACLRYKLQYCQPEEDESADDDKIDESLFLTGDEASGFCNLIAETAVKFCKSFQPPMPPVVIWTAFTYFKRFYIKHSILERGPRNVIMGCLYLACKVEEFNISASDFVSNLKAGTAESNLNIILDLEPFLMRQLDYHLTIHSPYRPLEGHMITLKTHWSTQVGDCEKLRAGATAFLDKALISDSCLLYPPSQIGLAALYDAAKGLNVSLDEFISHIYFSQYPEGVDGFIAKINEIIKHVKVDCASGKFKPDELKQRVQNCATKEIAALHDFLDHTEAPRLGKAYPLQDAQAKAIQCLEEKRKSEGGGSQQKNESEEEIDSDDD